MIGHFAASCQSRRRAKAKGRTHDAPGPWCYPTYPIYPICTTCPVDSNLSELTRCYTLTRLVPDRLPLDFHDREVPLILRRRRRVERDARSRRAGRIGEHLHPHRVAARREELVQLRLARARRMVD